MKWLATTRLGLLAFFLATSTFAQSGDEGSIEGFITDPSDAVISGANVTARDIHTAAIYRTATDGDGRFRFLALPVGAYEVTAEHAGFATLIYKDVVVTIGAKVNLPLTLPLASQTQRVEVNSETPLVEPGRTHVSSTIDEHSIANLPVNGRNFNDFIVLAPGVIRGPVSTNFGSGIPSVGGQRSFSMTLVDGAENAPAFFEPFGSGAQPYQFSLESVREFQVNANSYSAELGHAGNGVISVVTKSGTNDFHGSLFWYFRDKGLNATDLIRKINSQPKEPLHIHQFGGAAGGPILRNKLFFFAGYDAQRRNLQNPTLFNLPNGFSLSSDPTVAGFQTLALDYLGARSAPYMQTLDQDVYFAKMDWRITSTQLLSARWNTQRFTGNNSFLAGPPISLENNTDSLLTNHSVVVSLSSTSSSSIVNVARFGYLLNDNRNQSNSVNPQANIFEAGQQVLLVGHGPGGPQRTLVRQFDWSDTLSMRRDRHTFKLGGDVLLARNRQQNVPAFSGSYRFNSLESFGRSLAQLPVCNPPQNPAPASCRTPLPGETYIQAFSGEGKPSAITFPNSTEFASFLQDEWRARTNLVFNLGLRYDIQFMAKPPVRNPAPALAAVGLDTSFLPLDENNFAPRLGFAWAPLRGQRLVVRGGYGLFFARLQDVIAGRAHSQNGVSVETRTFAAGTSSAALIPAYPNTLCGAPDPSGLPPSCPPPITGNDTIQLFSRNYVQPYDQHASLGIEFQLRDDWAISASYLMVNGTHLPRWRDINLTAPAPTKIGIAGTNTTFTYQLFPATRPIFPGFDRIFVLASDADSTYHGMVVQLNKRFAHNFQFLAGYTLGRVIDDRPEAINFNAGGPNDALLLSDSFNPGADHGPGIEDARHRFVLSGVWDLNYANRLRGVSKAILGGWDFSGILALQSGLPYSGLVNFDLNNDGNSQSDRTPGQPRNTFRLPTTLSFDPRLTRNVAVNEWMHLQLIWEAFNVFNRVNISDVRTTQFSRSTSGTVCGIAGTPCLVPQNTGATSFGSPAATLGPRIMQLALKLSF